MIGIEQEIEVLRVLIRIVRRRLPVMSAKYASRYAARLLRCGPHDIVEREMISVARAVARTRLA